ncbi:MAG: tetraacyldisaccharide 4'-kinase [Acidobacteria bacterium]|nr:tetraacyldisaccharide 4'-kinase [Acidobacteriota bacterium]
MLSTLYAKTTEWRRRWYARHPEARRRLRRPVISVGNLTLGGTGKTPLVAAVARLLLERGERPSILSRGYGRRHVADGVVVVADGAGVRADLRRSGDEPLMLARHLPGAAVLVSPDRYLAGTLAEHRLGCTVHLLDDGFQHVMLERNVDLLAVDRALLTDPRPLPRGRLRESIGAAGYADAVIAVDHSADEAAQLAAVLRVTRSFIGSTSHDSVRLVEPFGEAVKPAEGARTIAVAGIARPARFYEDLERAGWTVAARLTFPDHHAFSAADVRAVGARAAGEGIDLVITTEKDLMRLLPHRPFRFRLGWLPHAVSIEPSLEFAEWLTMRIAGARTGVVPD